MPAVTKTRYSSRWPESWEISTKSEEILSRSDVYWQQSVLRKEAMDFIEKLFGVAPDGGNGLLELSLVFAGVAAAAWLVVRRSLGKRRTVTRV